MHFRNSNHVGAQLDVYISTPLSSNRKELIKKAIEHLFKYKEIKCVYWWENGTYDPYTIKKCDIIITIDPENQWTQTFSSPGMVKELTPFTKEIPSSKLFFGMYKRATDGEYCFYNILNIYKDSDGAINVALKPGGFMFKDEVQSKQLNKIVNDPANKYILTGFNEEIIKSYYTMSTEELDKGIISIKKHIDRRVLLSIL